MPLTPITKRLVPDDVYDQLLDEVVSGSLGPGDALPSERRLAELLGVSRPAVREALQRLSATRLVEVRHGGSTTVRDFRRSAGLELLPRLLVRAGELDPAVARSIVEARIAIAPGMVRLAAERAPRRPTEAAQRLEGALSALDGAPSPFERQRAALAFWDVLVDLADSVVFRLLYNDLKRAYEPAMEALAALLDGEVSDLTGYQRIVAAVLAGLPQDAAEAVTALLGPATAAMVAFLDDFDENPGE